MFVVVNEEGKILSDDEAAALMGIDRYAWTWAFTADEGLPMPILISGCGEGEFTLFYVDGRKFDVLDVGGLAWRTDFAVGKVEAHWEYIADRLQRVMDEAQFAAVEITARKPRKALEHMVEAVIALAAAGVSLYHVLDAAEEHGVASDVQDYGLIGLAFRKAVERYKATFGREAK